MRSKLVCLFTCSAASCIGAAVLAVTALCACNSHTSPGPPTPESRRQETADAERKAASVEAEMNKDSRSEDIAPASSKPEEQGAPSSSPR
jgi:hypothetical protein